MALLARIVGRLPHSWITWVSRLRWRIPVLKPLVNWAANRFRNRDGEIQKGQGQGLKFNAGGANAGYLLGTSEPEVQSALAALIKPAMVVYDIGANIGFYSMIAARLVGPEGHVVAFEPLPANVKQITHNAELNDFANVTVRVEALGNENGSTGFFSSTIPTLGRFSKLGEPEDCYGETSVIVRRLDDVLNEGLPRPDVIKMDVEGAEVDVLKGGRETIAKYRPLLLIELHGTNKQVADALEEQGYTTSVLDGNEEIRNARWNAHIVARPKSDDDL